MPVVRTDGLSDGRSVYGHVITKFSRMSRLLHFLTHGAPLARFASETSAISGNAVAKQRNKLLSGNALTSPWAIQQLSFIILNLFIL